MDSDDNLRETWINCIIPACSLVSLNSLYFTCRFFKAAVTCAVRARFNSCNPFPSFSLASTFRASLGTDVARLKRAFIENNAAPLLIQRTQSIAPKMGDIGMLLFAELTYRTATEFYGRPYLTAAFLKAIQDRLCDVFVDRFAPCQNSDDMELLKVLLEWRLVPSDRLIWLRFRPPLSYEALELDTMDTPSGDSDGGNIHLALLNSLFDKRTNFMDSIFSSPMSWYRLLVISIFSQRADNVRLIVDAINTQSSIHHTNSEIMLAFRRKWLVFPSIMAIAVCSIIGDVITPMLLEIVNNPTAQMLALEDIDITMGALRQNTRSIIQTYYSDHMAVAEARIALIQ